MKLSPSTFLSPIFITILLIMLIPTLLSRYLSASSLFSPRADSKTATQPVLRVNHRNEFHITIFADLHYGEEESGWGIDQDVGSTRVMSEVLRNERPDLVVLNGDLITGENTFLANSTKYLDVVVAPIVKRNIPFASTYGNHDSQFNLARSALFAEEEKYALSYTQHSPPGIPGITNYWVPIYAKANEDTGVPLAILWFFDSQGGAPFQAPAASESIPNWVEPSVAAWFITESQALKVKYGRDLPSLAFVHIPPTAFLTVQQNLLPHAGDASALFPGLNDDVPLAPQGDGWQDVPFMQALVDTPGLHSVYSGHDHGDAWCANWPVVEGVREGVSKPHLCFCKHTGYGGYGNWNRGARVLNLKFGNDVQKGLMDVETWVRMEGGSIVQRVGLNETYGVDVYSTVDGE